MSDTKYGAVVSKWPRKRGAATGGAVYYNNLEFGLAAQWTNRVAPLEYQTAIFQTAGSNLVPRDLLLRAMYGYAYTFFDVDGTQLMTDRDVNPNAQAILDQVTNVPGSMLYRSTIGWEQVPIGSAGYVLTSIQNAPKWMPPQAGGGSIVGAWQLLDQNGAPTVAAQTWAWSALTPSVTVVGLQNYSEICVLARQIATTSNTTAFLRLSSDQGATFYAASGDYVTMSAAGAETAVTNLGTQISASATPKSTGIWVPAFNQPVPKFCLTFNQGQMQICTRPVVMNALGLFVGAGNINTGSKLYVYGR